MKLFQVLFSKKKKKGTKKINSTKYCLSKSDIPGVKKVPDWWTLMSFLLQFFLQTVTYRYRNRIPQAQRQRTSRFSIICKNMQQELFRLTLPQIKSRYRGRYQLQSFCFEDCIFCVVSNWKINFIHILVLIQFPLKLKIVQLFQISIVLF